MNTIVNGDAPLSTPAPVGSVWRDGDGVLWRVSRATGAGVVLQRGDVGLFVQHERLRVEYTPAQPETTR